VVRVEAPEAYSPPDYLREAAFRLYRPLAATWYAGSLKEGMDQITPEKANGESFVLVPGKSNVCTIHIGCYLEGGAGSTREGLLPLPEGAGRLDNLPAFTLRVNTLGTVVAEGPGVVLFDAYYGPGASMDGPTNSEDYQVPVDETKTLKQVVSDLGLTNLTTDEKLQKVGRFFRENFTYTVWLKSSPAGFDNGSALKRFLLTTRRGHCEYFATATVLLLREAGIPARYAVGFAMPPPTAGKYLVRERDAHAWCLVWKDGAWHDFDTTPPAWREVEAEEAPPRLFLSDLASNLWFEFSKFRWGQSHLREYLLMFLVPVLGLLLFRIVARKRRARRGPRRAPEPVPIWPGLDSEFYRLEKKLAERGVSRAAGEPLSAWLARAASEDLSTAQAAALERLLQLHYRYRFDPLGLDPAAREALREGALDCVENLSRRAIVERG
jgi:transglutaminase-like putative cysteine protease